MEVSLWVFIMLVVLSFLGVVSVIEDLIAWMVFRRMRKKGLAGFGFKKLVEKALKDSETRRCE